MIEFLTVFVGFFTGVHTVEFDVGHRVASVEVRLDGRQIGRLRGEPWSLACDFGSALEPHELEAIAYDGEDRLLQRIRQAVNFKPGAPRLGGSSEDLTSVVIGLERGTQIPPPEEMDGWFISDGVPLKAVEVTGGRAEIMIVLEPTARPIIEFLTDEFLGLDIAGVKQSFSLSKGQKSGPDAVDRDRWVSATQDKLRRFAPLDPSTGVRVVSPLAAPPSRVPTDGAVFFVFFARRIPIEKGAGFLWAAERASTSQLSLRLADSIAVAAAKLHVSGRPRAVVVILADDDREASLYSPAQVRAYLDCLGVPLYVWSVVPNQRRQGWGEVSLIGPPVRGANTGSWKDRFWMAVETLNQRLERQRVIWLAGRHLPQGIELGHQAPGITLLGSPIEGMTEMAQR